MVVYPFLTCTNFGGKERGKFGAAPNTTYSAQFPMRISPRLTGTTGIHCEGLSLVELLRLRLG